MFPAIFAALKAANLTQKGITAGVVVGALLLIFAAGYLKGLYACKDDQIKTIAIEAHQNTQQALQGAEMGAKMAGTVDEKAAVLVAGVSDVERKVDAHAKESKKQSCLLDPSVLGVIDEYTRLLNANQNSLSAADGGAGQPQVQAAGVENKTAQGIQINVGGQPVDITLEELNHYIADLVELHGRMEIKYAGLSDWDDNRLTIERKGFEDGR